MAIRCAFYYSGLCNRQGSLCQHCRSAANRRQNRAKPRNWPIYRNSAETRRVKRLFAGLPGPSLSIEPLKRPPRQWRTVCRRWQYDWDGWQHQHHVQHREDARRHRQHRYRYHARHQHRHPPPCPGIIVPAIPTSEFPTRLLPNIHRAKSENKPFFRSRFRHSSNRLPGKPEVSRKFSLLPTKTRTSIERNACRKLGSENSI